MEIAFESTAQSHLILFCDALTPLCWWMSIKFYIHNRKAKSKFNVIQSNSNVEASLYKDFKFNESTKSAIVLKAKREIIRKLIFRRWSTFDSMLHWLASYCSFPQFEYLCDIIWMHLVMSLRNFSWIWWNVWN